MKNKILKFSILSFAAVLAFSNVASAEFSNFHPKTPSDYQLSKVGQECSNLKKHFTKLRSTDALKRVNLGEIFENISNELMAKLNSRIALNKMNGANLVAETANFDQKVEDFRIKYRNYERELRKLTEMECSSNSAKEFYLQIEKIRFLRNELNISVNEARDLANRYEILLKDFQAEAKI